MSQQRNETSIPYKCNWKVTIFKIREKWGPNLTLNISCFFTMRIYEKLQKKRVTWSKNLQHKFKLGCEYKRQNKSNCTVIILDFCLLVLPQPLFQAQPSNKDHMQFLYRVMLVDSKIYHSCKNAHLHITFSIHKLTNFCWGKMGPWSSLWIYKMESEHDLFDYSFTLFSSEASLNKIT